VPFIEEREAPFQSVRETPTKKLTLPKSLGRFHWNIHLHTTEADNYNYVYDNRR